MAAVRKEISKDDYKFFIGRVEKIGNGQVEFITDTQKKAVELLGEKIPQNVIDAEDNYKAFNIWLGSEINPIIVGEGGYKEEIHVIGDGYDFFEVKAETGNTEFKYYLKALRPLFGAVPSGYIQAEKFENAVRIPRQGYVFGTVIYNKPLTDEQVRIYDLKPDKNNPQPEDNTAAAVSNAEITACLDDYAVDADVAAEVEIENEINNRIAEENKRHEFIASVLNMGDMERGKKIKLIPQEYYNYGEPETLTARKVAFRSFDYYQMDSGNYNIRIIPQGHEAMSWVAAYKTEAQAQEVIKMLGAAIQRGDEQFIFPTVEELNTSAEVEEIKATVAAESKQFEVGKWYYNCSVLSSGGLAYKVTHRTKKMVTLTDSFGEVIRRKPETTFGVEEISLDAYEMLEATRFCTNADEIQKAEDDLAYSLGQDAEDDAKDERRQELITAYYAGKNAVDEVETDSDDLAEVEEVTTEKNPLKEKIAEILNRPRRSCIDWTDAIFQNVTLPEIFKAQKELKKFLKLGQLDLAENIFAMLKTLCKNYREQFAA